MQSKVAFFNGILEVEILKKSKRRGVNKAE